LNGNITVTIGGGAYEAQRLVSPQNIGPGGTLCSVPPHNFCHQILLDPQIVVVGLLDAFCGIKNTKIDFGWGFAPDPTVGAYTALPYLIAGGEGS